jgi:glutathione synthase
MKHAKSLLWILDPWETLDHKQDTSLRLITEARVLGHQAYWCSLEDLEFRNGTLFVTPRTKLKAPTNQRRSPSKVSISTFAQIHYRIDPPLDSTYYTPLQWASLHEFRHGILPWVNPLSLLLRANEKNFGDLLDLAPPSVTSSAAETLWHFTRKTSDVILKPLHQAQSKGVLRWTLRPSEKKFLRPPQRFLRALSEVRSTALSGSLSAAPIMVQMFLKDALQGETRVWICDHKVLSSCRKIPKSGEAIIRMDEGGTISAHEWTREERQLTDQVLKLCRSYQIRLAAVDMMGGYVTDFNFTSPGLLVQMEHLEQRNLARQILQSLTRSISRSSSP